MKTAAVVKTAAACFSCYYVSRDDVTRTRDSYVPNVVRYQLRYIPLRFLPALHATFMMDAVAQAFPRKSIAKLVISSDMTNGIWQFSFNYAFISRFA